MISYYHFLSFAVGQDLVNHNLIKMGCISSKVVSRSTSFREQLNLLQKKADGITCSRSGAYQPLLGSFASESNSCLKAGVDLGKTETSETWELTSNLEQEEGKQMQPPSPLLTKATESIDADSAIRSKSCHLFQNQEVTPHPLERSDEIKEERSIRSRSDKVHAWSFHTVEEFDEMMERIHFSRVKQTGFAGKDEGFSQLHHSKSSSYSFEHAEQAIKQLPSTDESQVEENTATEEDIFSSSRAQTTGVIQSPNSSRTAKGSDVFVHAAQNLDKGFRRKAMANELESLKMPTTIEFQGAAILQKFLHVGGQVYSPGAYVTPKFGGYSLPNDSGPANKYIDGTIFDPELVAATEKAMEQLELEEENILKQIEENFKGEARLIGD